jgi:glycosyltransferase involved in cell wall biosynthesis
VKRVLVVQPVAQTGGSDQALLAMVRGLPADRFETHVVVPEEPMMRAQLEAAGARIHVVPMRRLTRSEGTVYWLGYALAWPVSVARLVALTRRMRAHVLVSNSLHSWYGWAAAWLTRRPHVWIAREIVVGSAAATRLERVLTRRFATVVVSMSRAIAGQLDPRDGRVFTDTVDTERYRPDRAGAFRAAHGIADDAVLVGAAGRIDVWKGIGVLLDAWARVAAEVEPGTTELRLVVVGPPVPGKEAYERGLRERAASIDGVLWLDPLEDLGPFYADLDAFVMASTDPEPFGLVMAEALASGVPVIATDHGGPPEVLGGHPERGTLVPPRDAAALAAAIRAIAARPPSSSTTRAARPPLWIAEPPPWAELFDEVARRGR